MGLLKIWTPTLGEKSLVTVAEVPLLVLVCLTSTFQLFPLCFRGYVRRVYHGQSLSANNRVQVALPHDIFVVRQTRTAES